MNELYSIGEQDREYMRRAIGLACNGAGFVNPNPLVGAVIVKGGKIIGEGWHKLYGGLHAERNAFKNATEETEGATMYVTLEPCCHFGKTPPCTDAIIEHKIARVIVGLSDPNPLVSGKGVAKLRNAGIEVFLGVEEEKIRDLNRVFIKYITTKMPWVVMKTAMTLDGKIAAYTGDSKWVTGEKARERVQRMRGEFMGIMVGAGTVNADDPMLNCRLEGNVRQPVRIIVDSRAGIGIDSRIVKSAKEYRTVVAHIGGAVEEKLRLLKDVGVELVQCEESEGHVAIPDLLKKLGSLGIDSVLLEGGGELNYSFIKDGLVDEVFSFVAPKIIGGKDAKTPVEGKGFARMDDAIGLKDIRIEMAGEDILIRGKCSYAKETN